MRKRSLVSALAVLALGLVVFGCNPDGGGEGLPIISVLPAPEELTFVKDSPYKVTLTWSAVEGASYYQISRKNDAKGYIPLEEPTSTAYIDSKVGPGIKYTYLVAAVSSNGTIGLGKEVEVTTDPVTTNDSIDAPATVTPTAQNSTSIKINWSPVPVSSSSLFNYTSYSIYRSKSENGKYDFIVNVSSSSYFLASDISYTDKDLDPETTYWYEVAATIGTEEGKRSTAVSAKTLKAPEEPATNASVDELVDAGTRYLLDNQYDLAAEYYERAYVKDPANQKALIYSSLAKIASIPREPGFQSLMKDRIGLKGFPSTLGEIYSDDWFSTYTNEAVQRILYDEASGTRIWFEKGSYLEWDYEKQESITASRAGYYKYERDDDTSSYKYVLVSTTPVYYTTGTNLLPGLVKPAATWFAESYEKSLTSVQLESISTWQLLMFANLLERNTNGLNDILDSVLSSVLGDTLNTVIARIDSMKYGDGVPLDQDIIEAFGLDELLEGDGIYIGKVEMEILTGLLRILRGTVEWVSSYDWNTDLSFLKFEWYDGEADSVLIERIEAMSTTNIPLRNNFLKARGDAAARLAKSKEDFIAAVTAAQGVWDHIDDNGLIPQGFKDELKKQAGIQDGLSKLKAAIQNGGKFYIPNDIEHIPSTWPTSGNGIDLDKFFTPGYLAIDKFLELESGGRSPVFYGFKGDADPVQIKSASDITTTKYDVIGFKITTTKVEDLVIGFTDLTDEIKEVPLPVFPVDIGKAVYNLYHK
jgi:hypothetical protein